MEPDTDLAPESRDGDARPLRPFVELTPEACGEVLRALRVGLNRFRQWSIAPPSGTWAQDAISWLNEIVERNSIGRTDEDLRRTSATVAWAIDLYHISTCLGDESFRTVAVELGKITHGRLLGDDESFKAKSYLTQFWVGALLAQSKLHPRVIANDSPGKPKPDFLIERGGVDFAVEVKRPRSRQSAWRNVLQAGDQLRDYTGPSIIVVDGTDCMSTDPWGITRGGPSIRNQIGQEISEFHHALEHLVESYSRSNKFHQVAVLLTFARYWPWVFEEKPRRDAGIHFHASVFPYRWSHQITGLSKDIQESLIEGMTQLTGNKPSYRFV